REQASSATKKSATEQRAAALAIQQAELRLQQVRSQGGRYALSLQNAELRLQETRNRVGNAQKAQDKNVADAKKDVTKATENLSAAERAELKAREGQQDALKGL